MSSPFFLAPVTMTHMPYAHDLTQHSFPDTLWIALGMIGSVLLTFFLRSVCRGRKRPTSSGGSESTYRSSTKTSTYESNSTQNPTTLQPPPLQQDQYPSTPTSTDQSSLQTPTTSWPTPMQLNQFSTQSTPTTLHLMPLQLPRAPPLTGRYCRICGYGAHSRPYIIHNCPSCGVQQNMIGYWYDAVSSTAWLPVSLFWRLWIHSKSWCYVIKDKCLWNNSNIIALCDKITPRYLYIYVYIYIFSCLWSSKTAFWLNKYSELYALQKYMSSHANTRHARSRVEIPAFLFSY